MQCACAILSSVACPALQYFSHYLINGMIFEKMLWNLKCAFRLSLHLLSETFPILRRNERDMIKKYIGLHVKYPLFIVRFHWNLNFLDSFSKNTHISNFMKIRPVGAELFHADGRTDMTKLIVAFRNFSKAPKTGTFPQTFLLKFKNKFIVSTRKKNLYL